MIAVAAGVKVLVATKPVDFRKGADGPRLFERHCSRSHEPISISTARTTSCLTARSDSRHLP